MVFGVARSRLPLHVRRLSQRQGVGGPERAGQGAAAGNLQAARGEDEGGPGRDDDAGPCLPTAGLGGRGLRSLRGVPALDPRGREGLGAKGVLDLRKIRSLAKGENPRRGPQAPGARESDKGFSAKSPGKPVV